jgi:hypothetical protein
MRSCTLPASALALVTTIVHDCNAVPVSLSFHSSHSPASVNGESSRAV